MVDQPLIRAPNGLAYVIDEPNMLRVNVSGGMTRSPQRTLLVDKPSVDTEVQMMTPHWSKRKQMQASTRYVQKPLPALKFPDVMSKMSQKDSIMDIRREPLLKSDDSFDPANMTNFFSEANFIPASMDDQVLGAQNLYSRK